jgi:MFS family permease
VISNYFSWRWILFVNVPVGLVLALVAPRVLQAAPARRGRLDIPGAAAVTIAATLLVYGLSRAAQHGWTDQVTLVTLAGGCALMLVFVAIEAVSRSPLMPLAIFANRNRNGAYALSLTTGAALSGTLFALTLFLQNVLGLTPLQAGFAFLPTAIGVAAGAAVTSRVIGRTGPRLPMATGALMAAAGLFWLSAITVESRYPVSVLGPLVVLALGLGQVFVATSTTAIAGARPDVSGIVAAVLNVGRQLGGSIGIALMGTLATTIAHDRLAGVRPTPAAIGLAMTDGFAAAFQLAGFIALLGFAATIVFVRGRRASGQVATETAVEAQAA